MRREALVAPCKKRLFLSPRISNEMREVLPQAVVHDLVHTLTRSAMAVMSHLGFATINRARVQTLRSNVPTSHKRTVYFKNRTQTWRERGAVSLPQFHGLVVAAGCQKRRRRVKRNRENIAAVLRQSRHTSRRRVVAGQQPQSHGMVAAAGCQKRRRRVKRDRANIAAVPLQSRHTSRRRVVEDVAARENACPQSVVIADRALAVEAKQFSSKDHAQSPSDYQQQPALRAYTTSHRVECAELKGNAMTTA